MAVMRGILLVQICPNSHINTTASSYKSLKYHQRINHVNIGLIYKYLSRIKILTFAKINLSECETRQPGYVLLLSLCKDIYCGKK